MRAFLVVALLLAALPGGLTANGGRTVVGQQSSYTSEPVAGLLWQGTPAALTPTNFTIMFPDNIVLANDDRIEIHLPGFGGAYNSFGAIATGTTLVGNYLPAQNGIKAFSRKYTKDNEKDIAQVIQNAEWDPKREVLKVKVTNHVDFEGVTIDEGYLRQFYQRDGLPSGKGPLPPRGGIDATWYKKAWVHKYAAAACSGATFGIGSERCNPDHSTADSVMKYMFNRDMAHNMMFETVNDWVPTQNVGAVGTITKPAFSWLAAAGNITAKEQDNCISVTLIPSVTLTTTDASTSRTDITLSGLTGSDTADVDNLRIYAGSECKWEPGARDIHDNTNSIRAAYDIGTADVLVSPLSSAKAWAGKFDKAAGTLVVRIGTGFSIAAGEVMTFSFKLTNGKTPQGSRQLAASVTDGYYCTSNLCGSSDDEKVTIAPTVFNVMSKILEIKEPTFDTAVIHQSTTRPQATATITVSLKTNTALLTSDSEITLSGLCGSSILTGTSISLLDMFGKSLNTYSSPSTFNFAASADWDGSKKQLKIKTGTVGLVADMLYVVKFQWELLDAANNACPVTVSASGRALFAATTMTGTAGQVAAPAFVTAKVGQTSTRPDSLNFICVTLKTNKLFNSASAGRQEQSKFTIAGLDGSQLETASDMAVYECPSNRLAVGSNEFDLLTKDGWAMPTSVKAVSSLSGSNAPFRPDEGTRTSGQYEFNKDGGKAVFVMDSTGFAADQEYVFAIMLKNSKTASTCKTLTLSSSGDITQTVSMTASRYARALVDGETDGDACPLTVYDPGFLTKIVSSDNQRAEQTATITVTLRSNVDLASSGPGFKSMITLSGLTGSKTDDSTTLNEIMTSSTGNVVTAFSPAFDKVLWTRSSGTLVLELTAGTCSYPFGSSAKSLVQTCMKAGVQYVFKVTLVNGAAIQAAPPLSIQASYAVGEVSRKQAADGPLDPGCSANNALKIVGKDQILCSYKIGQKVTSPDVMNPICVTLKPRKNLQTTESGPVSFTITGLNGFRTDTDVYPDSRRLLKIRDSSTGEIVTRDTNRLGAPVLAHDKFCKASVTSSTTTGCKTGDENEILFSEVSGEATFYLSGTKTLVANEEYSFCFQVLNPTKAAPCKSNIAIKVRDSDMLESSAPSFPMTVATGDACVGYTSDREFTTASIRTSSNVTGMEAGLFIELSPNAEISAGKVITVSGLDNYATAAGNYDIEVTKNGRRDRDTFCRAKDATKYCEATWNGAGQLTFTVKAGEKVEAKDSFRNTGSTVLRYGYTPEEDDIYVIYLTLKNPALEQQAKAITVATEGFKADGLLDSGLASSRPKSSVSTLSSNGALVFHFTPKQAMAGGESIILELPHYTVGVEGPVFGITSSNAAFTTYADRSNWEVHGNSVKKARALFTNGYVASGSKSSERAQVTSGLDGFFMLATGDSDGALANKRNWFSESTLWEGTLRWENTDPKRYPTAAGGGGYAIATTTAWRGLPSPTNPNNQIAVDDLVGMRLTCSTASATVYTPDVFGNSHYVTESAYILENSAGGYKIVVESLFSTATFTAHGTEDTVLNAQCRIEYKPTVAKYTGMTVMFDNGKEFKIKQGAGALYQVSDGSGDPPSAHDIEGRAYTIYSQLEITAAQGKSVAAGETVTITIPRSSGIVAPDDLSAPVVTTLADDEKCTHSIVPNTGSRVNAAANNDLDTADTMTVVRKCNYAGMPGGDMSIAAKSTLRRVFASPVGRSSSNEIASTAKLSQVPPYKYDAAETGPHLVGKPLDVYGATSLLAQTVLAADEPLAATGITLTGAGALESTRTIWARERQWAGKAFVIGQEASGMTAPLDISAIQRVIAVADATQIEVGDYLSVGDEMMYVESVDGNYIGVVRGAAGTTAMSHKSLGAAAAANDNEKEYDILANQANGGGDRTASSDDEVPATGWVTIWKRVTKSFAVTTRKDDGDNNDIATVNPAATGFAVGGIGDADKGWIYLAGGTSAKEFLSDAAPDGTTINVDAGSAVATQVLPFVARNQYDVEVGDSVVLYSCGWGSQSASNFATMGGVAARGNMCRQTTLLGLPIIPVKSSAGIKPGDYLRVDFPKDVNSDFIVGRTEEEIYRVNAVIDNDLVVTHKPLAAVANDASNVNRYKGGTHLDLLSYVKTITYTSSAVIVADANSFTFTSSNEDVAGLQVGQYCLIDKEFMYISGVTGITVTIAAAGTPTPGTLARGNQGRSAFGTATTAFTNTIKVAQGDATVVHNAADVLAVGDVLSILGVEYTVLTRTDNTNIELSVPYAGATANAVAAGSVLRQLHQNDIGNNDAIYFIQHSCPTFEVPRANVAKAQINADATTTITLSNIDADAANTIVAGKYYKMGPEIIAVSAIDIATDKITVVRNIQTIPCRPSSQVGLQIAIDDDPALREVIFADANNPFTDGEDYQVDANRMRAGTAYVAGALGDMLEDVYRETGTATITPLTGKDGSGGTSFFASPWGKGGNVTEFCYAESSRWTTVTTDPGIHTGVPGSTAPTEGTMSVESLDALGVLVGDYIQVTPAGTAVFSGRGEYMRVVKINPSTKTLTVIRNVAPNCLGKTAYNGIAHTAGSTVTLMKPVYGTVQLVDSVTKLATQAGGADVQTASAGSCAKSTQNKVGVVDEALHVASGVTLHSFEVDGVAAEGLVVGSYLQAGTDGARDNYFLVTSVDRSTTDQFTVKAVRGVAPPCTAVPTAATTNNNDDLHLIAPGGCYVEAATADTAIAANSELLESTASTKFTVDAATGMTVGGYLRLGVEYMLISDIDTTKITVVRNKKPSCVYKTSGTPQLTSTLSAHAATTNVFVLSLDGTNNMMSTSLRAMVELSPKERIMWVQAEKAPQPPVPAPPEPEKKKDNLLLLLLLLLLLPIAGAVWWCCKKEPIPPVAKPMAPVYLPQNYPVLEMSPNPAQMAPMPPYGM